MSRKPKPCPSCGQCPTCGQSAAPVSIPWPTVMPWSTPTWVVPQPHWPSGQWYSVTVSNTGSSATTLLENIQ